MAQTKVLCPKSKPAMVRSACALDNLPNQKLALNDGKCQAMKKENGKGNMPPLHCRCCPIPLENGAEIKAQIDGLVPG